MPKQTWDVSSTGSNKFREIADRLVPTGVRVQYEKPPTGDRARFNYETGVLQAPRPVDEQTLWDFLHECAHAKFHWDQSNCRKRSIFDNVPRHVTEYECERWTRGRFAEEQILSDELIKHSSGYLMREIMLDLDAVLSPNIITSNGLSQSFTASLTFGGNFRFAS
jgi:hypothetical protein